MDTKSRTRGAPVQIDIDSTRDFFERRARDFQEAQPLTSILYQDAHPDIARARDAYEKQLVLPQLALHSAARVLDVGCGIGRWAEATLPHVAAYCGIDFSAGLIDLARQRCADPKARFLVEPAENAAAALQPGEPLFDRVIISGVLIYLNDAQIRQLLEGLRSVLAPDSLVYVREPVGTEERLTLDRFWSEELKAEYSAIYRSRSELAELVFDPLRAAGLRLVKEEPVYADDSLNNRRETRQYYFILRSEGQGA